MRGRRNLARGYREASRWNVECFAISHDVKFIITETNIIYMVGSAKSLQMCPTFGIPDSDGSVTRARNDVRAINRDCN